MKETKDTLQKEMNSVLEWEKNQADIWFWEKLGRLPFKLLDKWTPAFIQDKIGVVLDETGQYLQTGGRYLSSKSSLSKYYGREIQLEEVKYLPLDAMDEAVKHLTKSRKSWATLQGASTGIGGIFTLTLDIPLLLGIQIKTLQDIALCYGFDPQEKKERIFIVKCLQFVSADIVGKRSTLQFLTLFDQEEEALERQIFSEIQGWREVMLTYRDQFGWKKLFQMIPLFGLLFGAWMNRSSINDIAEAGMMLYKKRRILEKLRELEKSAEK